MNALAWHFPRNDSNENEGPNDGGIAHFTADRSSNVIRECIQNSLDARANEEEPVVVQIEIVSLSPESFAGASLQKSLEAAIASPHNDEAHKALFAKGLGVLQDGKKKGIATLRISDCNTSGAEDDLKLDGTPSKWEALTKSTGLSIKDQRDAGGSFGLGKHAPFVATDMRAVLYSTAWESAGQIHHRFQGKAILVSHIDQENHQRRKTGYLGSESFGPLCDDAVPDEFRMGQPGLTVYVPGYVAETEWETKTIATTARHFFHAIIRRGLKVRVGEQIVDSSTIDQRLELVGRSTRAFIAVSRTEPVAETDIRDIGHVTLRIKLAERTHGNRRQIALVRDAGMMITDVPRDMGIPGMRRPPAHWRPFTAIIECLSQGKPSILRDSESASHNRISTGEISDPGRRRRANEALKELGNWCRTQIGKIAHPDSTADEGTISEIGQYLSVADGQEGAGQEQEHQSPTRPLAISSPQQAQRPPRQSKIPGGLPGGTEVVIGKGTNPPNGEPGKRRRQKGPRRPRTTQPALMSGLRFQPGGKSRTHSVRVSFSMEGTSLHNVQLLAIGEDGSGTPVALREALVDGKESPHKNNKLRKVNKGRNGRTNVEFVTIEPIANRTFAVVAGDAQP